MRVQKKIITIIEPDAVTFTNSVVDATCNGGADGRINITGQGGSKTGYQTAIDGGAYEDKLNLTSLVAGEYTVKVKDSEDCESAEKIITIIEPDAVTFTNSVVDATCNGGADGRINITGQGGSKTGYQTAIDGGAYEDKLNLTSLVAGEYTVKVKDSEDCESAEKIITIIEPDAVTFTNSVVDATCNGGADGRINITGQGGSKTGYQTSIDGGAYEDKLSLTNLVAGIYAVKVKDSNGCESAEKIITIIEPDAVTFTNSVVDATCNGGADGRINITGQGGSKTGYQTAIDGGAYEDKLNLTSLVAGEYTVKVKDSEDCESAEKIITIIEPDAVTFTNSVVDATCNGGADGRINITGQGGSKTGYQTSIDGGAYEDKLSLTSLVAGEYKVKMKDSNGCESAEETIVITEPSAVTFTTSQTNVKLEGGSDGSINITSQAGGSGTGYQTSINGGAYEDKLSLTNLVAGEYKVKVKDSEGCESAEKEIIINGENWEDIFSSKIYHKATIPLTFDIDFELYRVDIQIINIFGNVMV